MLKALEMGGAQGLETVSALMEAGAESDTRETRDAPKCARLVTCDCGPPDAEDHRRVDARETFLSRKFTRAGRRETTLLRDP